MISHRHQCVFVHVPKTAGISIEHVFLAQYGLTWDERAPLLLRFNPDPALGPERLGHLTATDELWAQAEASAWDAIRRPDPDHRPIRRTIPRRGKPPRFRRWKHPPAYVAVRRFRRRSNS